MRLSKQLASVFSALFIVANSQASFAINASDLPGECSPQLIEALQANNILARSVSTNPVDLTVMRGIIDDLNDLEKQKETVKTNQERKLAPKNRTLARIESNIQNNKERLTSLRATCRRTCNARSRKQLETAFVKVNTLNASKKQVKAEISRENKKWRKKLADVDRMIRSKKAEAASECQAIANSNPDFNNIVVSTPTPVPAPGAPKPTATPKTAGPDRPTTVPVAAMSASAPVVVAGDPMVVYGHFTDGDGNAAFGSIRDLGYHPNGVSKTGDEGIYAAIGAIHDRLSNGSSATMSRTFLVPPQAQGYYWFRGEVVDSYGNYDYEWISVRVITPTPTPTPTSTPTSIPTTVPTSAS